jgi:ABC-type cobalamin transport system ATPase subunit
MDSRIPSGARQRPLHGTEASHRLRPRAGPQAALSDSHEATSSVDTDTEFRLREALARMVEGRTSIVVAHRLSTIQRTGRIMAMHKGRLRESGTHQQRSGSCGAGNIARSLLVG